MAQTSISVRMDEDLKKQFDEFCSDVGMNMTTAFCIFAKTVVRERRIPFEITTERDTFYSSEHLATLERRVAEMKADIRYMSMSLLRPNNEKNMA